MPSGRDLHDDMELEDAPAPAHDESDPFDFDDPSYALPPPLDLPPSESDHPPPLSEEKDDSATNTTPPRYLDDVDRMVCHEDFPQLLALAAKVKGMRESMSKDIAPSTGSQQMDPNQVISAVTRIQDQFVSDPGQDKPVVRKGIYPLTDSMMEESFHILQAELKRCEAWYARRKHTALFVPKTIGSAKRRKVDGDAIAVKYSKWQTDILMEWMISHTEHPFPDAQQIKELGDATGLSHSQVVNWTTNIRKRNLKATVENGKKPHHFLDFLFLAQDRERRQAHGLGPPITPIKTPARRKASTATKAPTSRTPYSEAIRGEPYPHSAQALRPYGGPMYYPHGPMMQHNGYHPHYQHPFPPPPYGYHQQHNPSPAADPSLEEDEWERKLHSVTYDEDISDPTMAGEEENPEALIAFAQYWKGDEEGLELADETMPIKAEFDSQCQITEEDTQHADASMTCGKRQRAGDSLSSMELMDLAGEDGSEVYDFVNAIFEV